MVDSEIKSRALGAAVLADARVGKRIEARPRAVVEHQGCAVGIHHLGAFEPMGKGALARAWVQLRRARARRCAVVRTRGGTARRASGLKRALSACAHGGAGAGALDLLHAGRAQLALVFERPSIDGREGFQKVGRETLVTVVAPQHLVLVGVHAAAAAPGYPPAGARLREEHLTGTRQIVVTGRDLAHSDPRFVFARHSWRTDNHIAALGLIEAGLGWAWQLCTLVQPRIKAGSLVTMAFENLSNGVQLWVDVTWSKERLLGLGRGALCN